MHYNKTLYIAVILTLIFLSGCKQNTQTNQSNITDGQNNTKQVNQINETETYQNKKIGFEIKYINGYKINENEKSVRIYHPSFDKAPIEPVKGGSLYIILTEKSIEEHIEDLESYDPPFSKIKSKENITLNNYNAIKLTHSNAMGIDYVDIYIENLNKKYLISYATIFVDDINEMLSTFKITD